MVEEADRPVVVGIDMDQPAAFFLLPLVTTSIDMRPDTVQSKLPILRDGIFAGGSPPPLP